VSLKENVTTLTGTLFNIEQHSDVIVTEFSINYQEDDGNYTRYFVIKNMDLGNNLTYLGKDTISSNPETDIYFKPTEPLVYKGNENLFAETLTLIQR